MYTTIDIKFILLLLFYFQFIFGCVTIPRNKPNNFTRSNQFLQKWKRKNLANKLNVNYLNVENGPKMYYKFDNKTYIKSIQLYCLFNNKQTTKLCYPKLPKKNFEWINKKKKMKIIVIAQATIMSFLLCNFLLVGWVSNSIRLYISKQKISMNT